MPAERIAESLAYINWTVLTALAVGTFGAAVVGRVRTSATRGYLGFIALTAAAFAALAAASDSGLPGVTGDSAPWAAARGLALSALAAAGLGLAFLLRRGGAGLPVAAVGIGLGVVALAAGAISLGPGGLSDPLATLLLFLQLAALSAALGGVWSAMVLGHWYLVTPKLPEAPLVRFSSWLTAILAVQVGLFVVWAAFGAGPEARPAFAELAGDWALFVWLRLLVGLIFPLIVSWAAIQTARSRSMESATGLLYINVGTIAAGTILAAGLYFGAGLLV